MVEVILYGDEFEFTVDKYKNKINYKKIIEEQGEEMAK